MKNITISIFLILLLFSAGCCASKKAGTLTDTVKTDSTVTKVTPRSVPVEIPGQRIEYSLEIKCDSTTNKPVIEKHVEYRDRFWSTAEILDGGTLRITAEYDSVKQLVEVMDTEITRYQKEVTRLTDIIEKPKPTPWYDYFCRTLTGLSILFVLILFVIKSIKPY